MVASSPTLVVHHGSDEQKQRDVEAGTARGLLAGGPATRDTVASTIDREELTWTHRARSPGSASSAAG